MSGIKIKNNIIKPMTHAEKLYEYMLLVVNSGGCLPIEDKDGDVRIYFMGKSGKIRYTETRSTLQESKNCGVSYPELSKTAFTEIAEANNWQPLTPFRIPTEPLPVGTKVRVNENAEEECRKADCTFPAEKKAMVGKVYEIDDTSTNGVRMDGWWFSLSAVTPVFEHNEEVPADVIKVTTANSLTVDELIQCLTPETKQILKDKLK